jgi:hypothetical protein
LRSEVRTAAAMRRSSIVGDAESARAVDRAQFVVDPRLP